MINIILALIVYLVLSSLSYVFIYSCGKLNKHYDETLEKQLKDYLKHKKTTKPLDKF